MSYDINTESCFVYFLDPSGKKQMWDCGEAVGYIAGAPKGKYENLFFTLARVYNEYSNPRSYLRLYHWNAKLDISLSSEKLSEVIKCIQNKTTKDSNPISKCIEELITIKPEK